ncbi:hypothetical protein TWF481_007908 [Arthrobotrys musiformis]|uniref:Peptidase metallopeptidase domain-containing protein n=1 Tax=Arthrobotrys musiformis TaxID=47236 RepID=A0AAV9W5P9_9PEZI
MAPVTVEKVAQEAEPAISHILTHLACFDCLPSDSETEKLESSSPLRQYAILSTGLANFQKCMKLPETGFFDIETAKEFDQPHCHNRDQRGDILNPALAVQYSSGNKKKITYCFNEYSYQLSVHEIRDAFHWAFGEWSARSGGLVTFTEIAPHPGKGDIRISWANRDGAGEDGPVFVAYPPPPQQSNSDAPATAPTPIEMYFDEDTEWTVPDLRRTALHHVGHILGLAHSKNTVAVMWPGCTNANFDKDDIEAVDGRLVAPPQTAELAQSHTEDAVRVWTQIAAVFKNADQILNIFPGPGGTLYAELRAGNILKYTPGETRPDPLIEILEASFPSDPIKQIVVSSHYLHMLTTDGSTIRRFSHSAEQRSSWESIGTDVRFATFGFGGQNRGIAASHGSLAVYRLTKQRRVEVFETHDSHDHRRLGYGDLTRVPGYGHWWTLGNPMDGFGPVHESKETKIIADESGVYFSWDNHILKYLDEGPGGKWIDVSDKTSDLCPHRLVSGDDTIYRIDTGDIVGTNITTSDPRRINTISELVSISENGAIWEKLEINCGHPDNAVVDFVASNSHRYIMCSRNAAPDDPDTIVSQGSRTSIWYNKRRSTSSNATLEWEDLKAPLHCSKMVAWGDDIYFMGKDAVIKKMSMS